MRDRAKPEIERRLYKSFIEFLTGMLHCTSISPVQQDYESSRNGTRLQEFDQPASHSSFSRIMPIGEEMLSLDKNILWMERLTHMAELNNLHVKSLARKLEEKREANRVLRDQIEMLSRENKELKDRNSELVNENKSLCQIIQINGINDCLVDVPNSKNKQGTRKLNRLKILLNAFCIKGEGTEHNVRERA